jgi:hypothetical protein
VVDVPKSTWQNGANLSVRVSPEMEAEIRAYAHERGMSVSEFLRYCAWSYMDTTSRRDRAEPVPPGRWSDAFRAELQQPSP